MRSVSNNMVSTLVRHLPRVINAIDTSALDLKTQNSVRLLKLVLKKLVKIENNGKSDN